MQQPDNGSLMGSLIRSEVGDEEQPRRQTKIEGFMVPIVFVVFVVFRAADRVLIKRVANAVGSAYFSVLMTWIWPLAIQVMTIIMLLGYIAMQRRQGNNDYNWRFFLPGNPKASSLGAVPIIQLALFSLGDQLNAALSAPPTPYISQTMQSVMTNAVLIWMVIIAFLWLGTRFKQVHYIGCLLVVLSMMVGISNQLSNNDCSLDGMESNQCLNAYKTDAGKWELLTMSSMAIWYGLFLFSTVPAAVSNVYKQKVLQERDVDVWYATWWSGNFQVLWGWLCCWVSWLPVPGHSTPGETPALLSDTVSCLMGNAPHAADIHCTVGSLPPVFWFVIYLFFNLSFNVCFLWLTKRMSAMWAQIATVLCLDLTNIFGQFKFIAGGGAQIMSLNDWLATITASMALWVYNMEPETKPTLKKSLKDDLSATGEA